MYLIGTTDQDGTPHLCTITWISYSFGEPNSIVLSMHAAKKTKDNIARTGEFTANMASVALAPLADYMGLTDGLREKKDMPFDSYPAERIGAPILSESPLAFECRVLHTIPLGDTITYIAEILRMHIDQRHTLEPGAYVDLELLDPVIYSGNYYRLGERFGQIGSCKDALSAQEGASKVTL